MRIGVLSQWFTPEPGPAALPGDLARGLAERGHQVEVLTGFPNYPTGALADGYRLRPLLVEEELGVRIVRVPLYPSHDASAVGRVANYGSFAASAATMGLASALRHVDALWVNYSPVSIALPMLLQRWIRRTPTVVHVLDLWPDTLAATGFASDGGLLRRSSLRVADALATSMYRHSDRVAFISPGVGSVLASRGIPHTKLAYAPMWADETSLTSDPSSAPPAELPAGHVCLTYAGTMGRAQELDTLVRACAKLRDLPFTCLMVGSGTEENHLRTLAREEGAHNVRFLGRLDRERMPDLMAMSDIAYIGLNDHPLAAMTMPSKLQATMSAGVAVLGSLSGDAASVIADSGAGWVASPGDVEGLASLLRAAVQSGRDSLSRRGVSARRYYDQQFSRSRGIARIEQLLVDARSTSK